MLFIRTFELAEHPTSTDDAFKRIVQFMIDELFAIREMENEKRLSVNEIASIGTDIAHVEVNFLGVSENESTRHEEEKTEVGISANDAIHILSERLKSVFKSIYYGN